MGVFLVLVLMVFVVVSLVRGAVRDFKAGYHEGSK